MTDPWLTCPRAGNHGDVHVIPIRDAISHTFDDCPCGPTVEPVFRDDGSNGWVTTHHSLDGREADE